MPLNYYFDLVRKKSRNLTWISIISTVTIIIMSILDTESDFKRNVGPYMDFITILAILLRILIIAVAIYKVSLKYTFQGVN